MRDLETLRKEIDAIDRELVPLFERRMGLIEDVATYKLANDLPVFQKGREAEVLEKNCRYLKNPFYKEALMQFFEDVMDISKHTQQLMVTEKTGGRLSFDEVGELRENTPVAFSGTLGAFGHIATQSYFGKERPLLACGTFEEVFRAIHSGEADYGVLPMENNSTGAIHTVVDLMRNYDVHIVGEQLVQARQCLMAPSGATVEGLSEIYSHPQGFEQSGKFLKDIKAELIPYENTALAAKYVAELSDITKGAIASEAAAEEFGLTILKADIQDNPNNFTRFGIFSKDVLVNEDCNKISIVVSLKNESGTLYHLLKRFYAHHINMSHIESRPNLDKTWEYYFYIDFEGNLNDKSVKTLLDEIEADSETFQFLGNYKGVC